MELRWPEIEAEVLRAKAERENEPFCAYVYDLPALASHAQQLKASLPRPFQLYYAAKANAEAPLLQALHDHVDGFEASSGGELEWLRSQFKQVPLLFSGPGKTDAELEFACQSEVELIHVESLFELQRLARIATRLGRRVPILLRLNLPLTAEFETSLVMGGKPTPFGVEIHQLPVLMDVLATAPSLELKGLHFHLLSHQLNASRHALLMEHYVQRFLELRTQYRASWSILNVGGGIGVNYRDPSAPFDWSAFCAGLKALGAQCEREKIQSVRFELGRYVSASCGTYAIEVLDVKRAFGQTFVVCRGGTHHFRTPQAQGHSHPFRVLARESWSWPFARPTARKENVVVVGQLCTPKDVLAKDAPIEQVRVGDLLLFPYAGAYAWNISHQNFLMHPPPLKIYLGQTEAGC